MQWGSGLSRHADLNVALDECIASIGAQIDDTNAVSFVAVFTSHHYGSDTDMLCPLR